MTFTAYVQASREHPNRLMADSTITIDGVTFPIPERGHYGPDRSPSRAAPHRISTALEQAGYQRGYTDLFDADKNGVFTLQVVKA